MYLIRCYSPRNSLIYQYSISSILYPLFKKPNPTPMTREQFSQWLSGFVGCFCFLVFVPKKKEQLHYLRVKIVTQFGFMITVSYLQVVHLLLMLPLMRLLEYHGLREQSDGILIQANCIENDILSILNLKFCRIFWLGISWLCEMFTTDG